MSFGLLENNFLYKSVGFATPSSPLTVDESSSIKDVVEIMKKGHISSCLVVGRDGTLSGIVSERDIVHSVILENVDLQERISKIMIKNPKTADTSATVSHILSLMAQGGYRHIPLVDKDNIPVGIISVKNIVTFIAKQLALAV